MFDVRTIATSSLGDRSYLAHDGEVAAGRRPATRHRPGPRPGRRARRADHPRRRDPHPQRLRHRRARARPRTRRRVPRRRPRRGRLRAHPGPRRRRDRGRRRCGCGRSPPRATPTTTSPTPSPTRTGAVQAVFTGGSMLYGTTGRTDLVSPDGHRRAHPRPVPLRAAAGRRAARPRPWSTRPTGSAASARRPRPRATPPPSASSATANPALTQDEQDFVDTLIAGLGAYPAYYARMAPTNARRPGAGRPLRARARRTRRAARPPRGRHRRRPVGGRPARRAPRSPPGTCAGSLSFELAQPFVTYLGWLLPDDAELTLIGETASRSPTPGASSSASASTASPAPPPAPWRRLADDTAPGAYRVVDFPALADRDPAEVSVVDARTETERAGGGVAGSVHIPLHELPGPPRRGPRRRGLGLLRLRLPRLGRGLPARRRPPAYARAGRRQRRLAQRRRGRSAHRPRSGTHARRLPRSRARASPCSSAGVARASPRPDPPHPRPSRGPRT